MEHHRISSTTRRTVLAGIAVTLAPGPLVAQAQQRDGMRRLGVLMSTDAADPIQQSNVASFATELEKLGWTSGRNARFDYRWGSGDTDRMDAYAAELVGLGPDVILAQGKSVASTLKATSTIPIVFVVALDLTGVVENVAHPGGNITGFTSFETPLVGKRLGLLKEIAPNVTRVAYISTPSPLAHSVFSRLVDDGRSLGVAVIEGVVRDDAGIEKAIASVARDPDGALIIAFDAFTTVHRNQIIASAARHRVPAIYPFNFFVTAGGLLSYGMDQNDQFRRAASYVDRILKGEKPGELPVQAPTKFDLVINLKTAKALGITIAPTLLAIADEVIE